jgi:hypothetical protein
MLVALCAILNIEEVMDNKDLIFNATSQNDVIKVSMGSLAKQNVCEIWRLTFINDFFFPLQHPFVTLVICSIQVFKIKPIKAQKPNFILLWYQTLKVPN